MKIVAMLRAMRNVLFTFTIVCGGMMLCLGKECKVEGKVVNGEICAKIGGSQLFSCYGSSAMEGKSNIESNGHIYKRYDIETNWDEAKMYCESLGGHLVTITSDVEQKIVEKLLLNSYFDSYWMGAQFHGNQWLWITGEVFDYTKWADGEPNDEEPGMCLQIYSRKSMTHYSGYHGEWDDTWKDGDHGNGITEQGFICEWDSEDDRINGANGVDESEFVRQHVHFIGTGENNTYSNLMKHCDLSRIALRDYAELKSSYDTWRIVRKKIFDNPYELVLADMVINEYSASSQVKNFELNLYSQQRIIINNVMELIEAKISLTSDEKNRIQKLFAKKDFSDNATYQLCEQLLGKKISKNELQRLFQMYDTSDKFMSLLEDEKKIVDSVVDVINYLSILQAYINTSDEFKLVLMQMDEYCQGENVELDYAIMQYLNVAGQSDIREKICQKVAGNSIEVGIDLFEDTITMKVVEYLKEGMDLSNVSAEIASKILSFVKGMKIGYHIGVGIDNILFNTDSVTDSYVYAYATAKTGTYLKLALEDNASNLRQNQNIKSAKLFCQAFNMYRKIQEEVANEMINYFSANGQALMSKIFKCDVQSDYEVSIYQWQIMKLSWSNKICHEPTLDDFNVKGLTIACPVDVSIRDSEGNLVIKIQNNQVVSCRSDAVACVQNGIKYISIPDTYYDVKIKATDDGTMSYCVRHYNNYTELMKTVNYDNIKLAKNTVFDGKIEEGELTEDVFALVANGNVVESDMVAFTAEEKISVESLSLSSFQIQLKPDEQYTLQATVLPENASIKTLSWHSGNPDIATVDEYGRVVAKSVGETSIICRTLDGNYSKQCDVQVVSLREDVTPSMSPVPSESLEMYPTSSPISASKSLSHSVMVKAPSTVKAVKVKKKKKNTIIVTWKKKAGVAGYQLQYSSSKKFKSKTTKNTKGTKKTINKLKRGRMYYIRIRAYKFNGAKKIYGEWSSVKKYMMK